MLALQRFPPALSETLGIDDLMGFDTLAGIGAVGDAFMVDDHRTRLVKHLPSCRPHPESKIAVLAIGRQEMLIKAAHLLPECAGQHDGGAGNIVHFADIIEFRPLRIAQIAVIPGRSVPPHDAAGLLQAAIGIDQFRPDQACIGPSVEQLHQRVHGARQNFGVVVEKKQEIAFGQLCRRVATPQKAHVLWPADEAQTGNPL